MTLKTIIETDLTARRKNAFETTKTLDTYREYYSVLDKSAQEKLKDRMLKSGYTFAQGGVYKDGQLLFNKDEVILTPEEKSVSESKEDITLGMIKDIELIDGDDKNYFISYSAAYSETPEHDELPKKLIRKLLKDNNVDAEEFWNNFVPYLDKNEAQVIISDIFGSDVKI
jgi:hypothetical protein